jgi:hypothetical protein
MQKDDTLDDLRREIDLIDDSLHDLLMRRSEVSRAIRQGQAAVGNRRQRRPSASAQACPGSGHPSQTVGAAHRRSSGARAGPHLARDHCFQPQGPEQFHLHVYAAENHSGSSIWRMPISARKRRSAVIRGRRL